MAVKIIKSKNFVETDFVESLAEVPVEEYKPWPENDKLKIVGKPVSRIDAYEKVSGTASYTTDKFLPNMVYGKILRSPHPNAILKNLNTEKAEKLEGVLKILSFKNCPEISWYYDTSLLFDKNLRYQGDEVACVAAISERIALEALKLIEVEYETLPFVTTASEAMMSESPKVHGWGNILDGKPDTYVRGDVEKGFNEADQIIEEEFNTQVVVHNPTEVHCSLANWDDDKLTIWDSTQAIFSVRDTVAASLKIPSSKVRVIKKFMGGGFGSKLEAGKHTIMAALISRDIGKPVFISVDRKEMNLAVGNRPDSNQKLKIGVKKDGTITALSHISYGSVGAYPDSAGCSWPLKTIYLCPNVKTEEYSVLTNSGRSRAMRAPGHVQGTFALEAIIDDAAEKIGMDPLEFRLKNYAETDQVFNVPYTSKKLKDAYLKGAEIIRWKRRNKTPGSQNSEVKNGIGMATQIWWGGGGPPAYAALKLNRDSSINVFAGSQDLGTGTYTFIAQVAAEVLEIPVEKIKVDIGDTDFPYCPLSGGSMTAPSVAPAIRDAAEQMKGKLISAAAAILNLPEEELMYSQGLVSSIKEKDKKISITEIVSKTRNRELITNGAREKNPDGYATNSFGVQFADVSVDTLTGKVKVNKIAAAYDIGRTLNPKTLYNQIHGGIIQGLGYALFEERLLDRKTGKVLTTNLHSYKIPTIKDAPEIEIAIVSQFDPLNSSIGVKGVGEPAIIPTAAAIGNAVYNAIGKRIRSLPITPDKIIKALYS
ncbi:MAG: xanthine dehydrogenase family protein molybdopterin-binding subunit [Ignavibacteriaceae bacterium]|nr:xanthine dehydrogenase family protein molybdopterin-binding subunit [Ignavibacteriaceae bacterium]